ncbi:STAS domain-containing protein [Colwellia sp. MEBiC06753]
MNLQTNHSTSNSVFTIKVDGALTIENYYDFRSAFLAMSIIGATFIMDLSNAVTLDVSALAMLLILNDYVDSQKGYLVVKFPTQECQAYRLLRAANFDKKFNLNSEAS